MEYKCDMKILHQSRCDWCGARATNNFMHLSHTLVLWSYRFSFNDMLPLFKLMNGLWFCKGNNELLVSMQYWELLPDHTAPAEYMPRMQAELLKKKNVEPFSHYAKDSFALVRFYTWNGGWTAHFFFHSFSPEWTWMESIFFTFNTKMHTFCYLIFHVENGFVKYV